MGTPEEHAREALSAELGAMRATVEAQGKVIGEIPQLIRSTIEELFPALDDHEAVHEHQPEGA